MSGMITDSKQVNIVHSKGGRQIKSGAFVHQIAKASNCSTLIRTATLKKLLKTATEGHRQ
jgi:hypothetical protein